MKQPLRKRDRSVLLLAGLSVVFSVFHRWFPLTFSASKVVGFGLGCTHGCKHGRARSRECGSSVMRGLGGGGFPALKELMKDPAQMKKMQEAMEDIMKDPAKKKALEDSVKTIQDDPELQDFFKDINSNGLDAVEKYEKDENLMRKLSTVASNGPVDTLRGVAEGTDDSAWGTLEANAVVNTTLSMGAEVVIQGLNKTPELNGKVAIVIPATSEERNDLQGTGRLVVRLVDSGEQFAVKPMNLQLIHGVSERPDIAILE